jgi:hypothetical protein
MITKAGAFNLLKIHFITNISIFWHHLQRGRISLNSLSDGPSDVHMYRDESGVVSQVLMT